MPHRPPRLPKRRIASSYLPNRYLQGYTFCKLATDPLYAAVCSELAEHREPLLDLGCGIGLLLQCLRASDNPIRYVGIDSDAVKIEAARQAANRVHLADAAFQVCDLSSEFPEHSGSVALLDVLQYLEPNARETLLERAARCLSRSGKLVMRIGLDDQSWRAALTRSADRLGHRARWMRSSFKSQPTREDVRAQLANVGLQAQFSPLWGKTPFNNYLVVAAQA